MTSDHLSEWQRNEYAEDLLPAEAREAAAAHLATCPACAAEVDAVRTLRSRLAALPRSVDPGVDLRPGIRSRVRGESGTSGARGDRSRAPLAAAAAVALVAGAAAVALLVDRGGDDVVGGAAGADPAARAVLALDREYGRAAGELRRALESGDVRLDPTTARLVRESLAVVDRAVEESRAALAEDPASPVARELVLAAHRQRLDVLRRATTLAADS